MSESSRSPAPGTKREGPFQFTLSQLFLVTTIVAVGCGIVATVGLEVVVQVMVATMVIGMPIALVVGVYCTCSRLIAALMAVGLTGILLMLMPSVGSRPPTRRFRCACNLDMIAKGLQAYVVEHGSLPPAYIADESGKPMHSWRVLILPYLGHQALYDAYDFDEPWDGPNNRKLAQMVSPVFRCPSNGNTSLRTTSYAAVVGPGTAWPGEKPLKLDDFADGLKNTILLVEVASSGIHWMEPRDLQIEQISPEVNPKTGQGISSNHPGVVNVLMADGSVRSLPDDLAPETLRALLSPSGGERLDLEDLLK